MTEFNTPTAISIFPQCVTTANIDRPITEDEAAVFVRYKKSTKPTTNNIASTEKYILDKEPALSGIKDFIMHNINYYVDNVLKPTVRPEFYITQSWLNWTHKEESHHLHLHHNSFLSGVFYVAAAQGEDSIIFTKLGESTFSLPTEEVTMFTAPSFFVDVQTGDTVIFRSNIMHQVPPVETDEVRISLAFNVFMRGKIGSYEDATELVLG